MLPPVVARKVLTSNKQPSQVTVLVVVVVFAKMVFVASIGGSKIGCTVVQFCV